MFVPTPHKEIEQRFFEELNQANAEIANLNQEKVNLENQLYHQVTLINFERRYFRVVFNEKCTDEKDMQLAELMSEMERTYRIPCLRNGDWEAENADVIELYRRISDSRNFS